MPRTSESAAEPLVPVAPLTQRAYTLRLRRSPGVCSACDKNDCPCWRDALWATHEAVNKGAKVFGDCLLALRGGLSHELVDKKVVDGKGANKKERDPNEDERRDRRILLALSWLSVESAPREDADPRKPFLIGCGNGPAGRERALREALRDVLQKRGVSTSGIGDPDAEPENEPNTWLGQCGPSLAARIRDDAVWVNRSAMFDTATTDWKMQDARKDAHTLLSFILSTSKDDFLTLPILKKSAKEAEDAGKDDEQEERQKAVKASSRGSGQRTRHPFSHLLGEGKPFGKPQRKLILRDQWHGYIKSKLEDATGISVLDASNKKKGKCKNDELAHTEIQREMFSKAASRVAQIVTKQRQQEADRVARKDADTALCQMEADPSYADALAALRAYCDEYRMTSGAEGEFTIRPRQITGWDRVVKRWAAIKKTVPEAAREARIEALKEAQDAGEEKKFGDANLFIRLADDRYTSVWRQHGEPDPTILERFVGGMKSRSDADRLKVAAFRHPDPYFNPICCQFGVSRPAIHFRRIKRIKAFSDDPGGNDPRAVGMLLWHPACEFARLTLLHGVSHRLDREIGSACDQVQPDAKDLCAVSRRGRLGAAAAGLPSADSPVRVAGVFDKKRIKSRFTDDDQEDAGGDGNGNEKFKEPKWNGTLSANRRELAVIGKLIEKGDIQKATRRRDQLRWTLTVSMEMEGRGPWFRYIATAQDKTPFVRTVRKDRPTEKNDRIVADGWPWQEFNKPLKDNNDNTALVEDAKAARETNACLILSRLPGLRILSVDLGHRFAASCAVWEAISTEDMAKACREHGHRKPQESDLFIHLTRTVKKERKKGRDKGKTLNVVETTICRRIGEDLLRNPETGKTTDTPHPAPWARLDRQFFTKIQGEERSVRIASEAEYEYVKQLEDGLHYARDKRTPLPWQVDQLMAEAVRAVRLALRRHGDTARLAFGLASEYKLMPGASKFWFTKQQDDDRDPQKDAEKKAADRAVKHTKYLQDLLCLWYDVAVSARWRDDDALNRWNAHVQPQIQQATFTEPPPLQGQDANDKKKVERRERQIESWKRVWERLRTTLTRRAEEQEEGIERSEWKPDRDAIGALLAPVAEALRNDPQKRKELATKWKTRWEADDTCWPGRLKRLRRWLLPRGLRARPKETQEQTNARKIRRAAGMNVGGLSLARLVTLIEFRRQVQVGYFTRLHPDGSKAEIKEEFGQRILDAVDRMREQRVKQIASRIVEAALGVGIERDRVWDETKKKWRYPKRPRELLYYEDEQGTAYGDSRFKTCHAVVIENLRSYKFADMQPRRENRALMSWSAGKVRKYLEEACQLHGLHLREVMPNYTSRQCSRTGLPGVRCDDVPIDAFLTAPWWNMAVNAATKRLQENGADSLDRLLVALREKWSTASDQDRRRQRTLRLPRAGGDLFVAAPPNGVATAKDRRCGALQADLNAAANIGLRALFDPDFPGRWWYVPCIEDIAAGTAVPRADKVKGSVCFGPDRSKPEQFGSLLKPGAGDSSDGLARSARRKRTRRSTADGKETTNFWSDPRAELLRNATNGGFWLPTPAYWRWVRKRVVAALWQVNGLSAPPAELVRDGQA